MISSTAWAIIGGLSGLLLIGLIIVLVLTNKSKPDPEPKPEPDPTLPVINILKIDPTEVKSSGYVSFTLSVSEDYYTKLRKYIDFKKYEKEIKYYVELYTTKKMASLGTFKCKFVKNNFKGYDIISDMCKIPLEIGFYVMGNMRFEDNYKDGEFLFKGKQFAVIQ